jgi:hypothetical protein
VLAIAVLAVVATALLGPEASYVVVVFEAKYGHKK